MSLVKAGLTTRGLSEPEITELSLISGEGSIQPPVTNTILLLDTVLDIPTELIGEN